MPEDFENEITIKQSVGEMLDQRIHRSRTLHKDVIGIGGVTDAYQAAEKKYRNTRALLKVILKHGFPIHLATKSTLILEDADILNQIAAKSWGAISITLPTVDPTVSKFLDFRSPSPSQRLEVIQSLKAVAPSLQVGALMIPVIPFLTDSSSSLRATVKAIAEAGADYLLFSGGMTMKDQQALWYLKKLSQHYPELLPKYEALFRFQYSADFYGGLNSPPTSYSLPVQQTLLSLCQEFNLSPRISRYLPNDFRSDNYRIAELLFHQSWEAQLAGKPWKNKFWAAHSIQELKTSIREVDLTSIENVKGEIREMISSYLATPAPKKEQGGTQTSLFEE